MAARRIGRFNVSVTMPPRPATAPSASALRSAGALIVAARASHSASVQRPSSLRSFTPALRAISWGAAYCVDSSSALLASVRRVSSGTTRARKRESGRPTPRNAAITRLGRSDFQAAISSACRASYSLSGTTGGLSPATELEMKGQVTIVSAMKSAQSKLAAGSSSNQVTRPAADWRSDAGTWRSWGLIQGTGDDLGLVDAGGQHHDRSCGQDRGHAHGECPRDDPVQPTELPGRVGPGDGVKLDQSGGQREGLGDGVVARLVEADMAVAADAKELEVQSAVGGDPAIELRRSARPRRAREPCRRAGGPDWQPGRPG